MEKKPSNAGPMIAAIAACVVSLLGVYVGGYFVLCDVMKASLGNGKFQRMRIYRYKWLAEAYISASRVENAIVGGDIGDVRALYYLRPGVMATPEL